MSDLPITEEEIVQVLEEDYLRAPEEVFDLEYVTRIDQFLENNEENSADEKIKNPEDEKEISEYDSDWEVFNSLKDRTEELDSEIGIPVVDMSYPSQKTVDLVGKVASGEYERQDRTGGLFAEKAITALESVSNSEQVYIAIGHVTSQTDLNINQMGGPTSYKDITNIPGEVLEDDIVQIKEDRPAKITTLPTIYARQISPILSTHVKTGSIETEFLGSYNETIDGYVEHHQS